MKKLKDFLTGLTGWETGWFGVPSTLRSATEDGPSGGPVPVFILFLILFILSSLPASASSSRIYATVSITNNPVNGNALNINGTNRWFLDTVTNAAINIVTTNAPPPASTNLFNNLNVYGYGAGYTLSRSQVTNIILVGSVNGAMSVNVTGNWASVTFTTNPVADMVNFRVPITGETNTTRTNNASGLVEALRDYPTNAFPTATGAFSNFVDRSTAQTIAGTKTLSSTLVLQTGNSAVELFPLQIINTNTATGSRTTVFESLISATRLGTTIRGGMEMVTIGTNAQSDLTFNLNADGGSIAESMRLTATGRLGIGLTNPATALDVVGTINASTSITAPSITLSGAATVAGLLTAGTLTNTPIVIRGLGANTTNGIAFQGVTGTNYAWIAPDTNGAPSIYSAPGTLTNSAAYTPAAENILNRTMGDARFGQLGISNYWTATNRFKALQLDTSLSLGTLLTNIPVVPGIIQIDDPQPFLYMRGFSSSLNPVISMNRFRAGGAQINSNDLVGVIYWAGMGATFLQDAGQIEVRAETNFSSTAAGTRMSFLVANTSNGQLKERLRLTEGSNSFVGNFGLISGMAVGITHTNSVFAGTNLLYGLAYPPRVSAALVNGNNAGIDLGTNVYVRLSGATTIAQIAGFAAQPEGTIHEIEISGSVTNILINEANSSYATDPTPANRIVTGTGGDFSLTNAPTTLRVIYNATRARWIIHGKSQ